MDVVRAGISAFRCDVVAENLLLVRETVREMGSLGGRRLLPPTAPFDGPSSLPATNGLTDRSSVFERSENIEEFEPALRLPSSDAPKGLDPAVSAVGKLVAGCRLSGRRLGSFSSLS